MLNMPILTKDDMCEAIKMQKRQMFEEERKKRIFNAKQRLFGLDLESLERQIADKAKQRHIEAECNRRYEEQTQRQQHAIFAKSLEMEKRQRVAQSDLNYYRCQFQRKDQRREFDLNDPEWIKKALPARIADDDIRLGISSAQVFSGEDLGHKERQQRQRAQQRAWLDQQVLERKQAEEARQKADTVMQDFIHSRDKRLEDTANSYRRVRHQMIQATRQYNCNLAETKRLERQRAKQEKNEDDMAEIYNMLTSDMLTENPDVAQSRTDPKKKIAFMYRGMTDEELHQFRNEQKRQMEANKQRDIHVQLMDKQWEQYALNMDRELMMKQVDLNRKRQVEVMDQVQFNQDLAAKQKQQQAADKELMTKNHVYKEFYDQFNKTSR